MELWTAFLVGLGTSLHCIGMCGPIAIALPVGRQSRAKLVTGRVLYNVGRAVTYGFMGLAAGLIGQTVKVSGYQQSLSIAVGVLLLLAVILPSKYGALLTGSKLHTRLGALVGRLWQRLSTSHSVGSLFLIGILNGFLPCGPVYFALGLAITTGSPLMGWLFMVIFGLGTLPVMLVVSLTGKMLGASFRRRLTRLIPVGGVVLAALFILRGLSLGIPLVSPKSMTDKAGHQTMECCHHAEESDSTHMEPSDTITIEPSGE